MTAPSPESDEALIAEAKLHAKGLAKTERMDSFELIDRLADRLSQYQGRLAEAEKVVADLLDTATAVNDSLDYVEKQQRPWEDTPPEPESLGRARAWLAAAPSPSTKEGGDA